MNALDKSQAIIQFDLNGNILSANKNFLGALGYANESEIKGRHHSMFVDPIYAQSAAYKAFWASLRAGHFQAGQYQRVGKNDKEVWIQATYNPVTDASGKPYKVIKFASDITQSVVKTRASFDKVQALIYFDMDGIISDANANFLSATGYSLAEIKGQHHKMFCDAAYVNSDSYREFWGALNRGELQAGEFLRYGKGGREIWLSASYTVRYDNGGKPYQVVKYASDITQDKQRTSDINQSINSVSTASQQLNSSIGEISGSLSVTKQAVDAVEGQSVTANASVQNLLSSADSMSDVVKIIHDISNQINLLALNAAIEAARAGDAGRGFAVVADEVKKLASKAGQSSEKIAGEISGIQHIVNDVASSLDQITHSLQEVVGTTATVAASVEQQSAVTNEISMNMVNIQDLVNVRKAA